MQLYIGTCQSESAPLWPGRHPRPQAPCKQVLLSASRDAAGLYKHVNQHVAAPLLHLLRSYRRRSL